ncbi:MAG TPA: sugar phosphate isomerase/epimerase family protein [Acidobacteriaceae bacterium]|nr:sugar phosphate isomerase/epimerase family protein [Acidobacteriaceae bacterium]
MASIQRLSFNQITANNWSLPQAVEGCVRLGVPSIALWRHKVHETGLRNSLQLVIDAGIHVSSLCRGGMFAAADAGERAQRMEDNFRAVDEAAELNADCLVLVVGAANGVTLENARSIVEDAVGTLADYAKPRGVRLALEPLHPMYAAERSVLVTLEQALELAARHEPARVGVIVDVFHVWWDPKLYQLLRSAGPRIFGFHVSDWLVPLPDLLMGRGMMGDGVIEIRKIREAVDAAGYSGPIEVEIFNQAIWDLPGSEILARVVERFEEFV